MREFRQHSSKRSRAFTRIADALQSNIIVKNSSYMCLISENISVFGVLIKVIDSLIKNDKIKDYCELQTFFQCLLCSSLSNNAPMAHESDAIPLTTLPSESSNRSSEIYDFDLSKELQKTYESFQSLNIESPIKFSERSHFYTEKLEYPRDGDEPGFIFIFNQESSKYRPEKRRGSTRDVNEIVLCMQRLGYNIERNNNILTDGGTVEVKTKLETLSKMNFSRYNSLIIFVLTHGHEDDGLETRDGFIHVKEVMEPFRENTTLKDKPKIFVFQACKGGAYTTTGEQQAPDSPLVCKTVFRDSYITPDTLLVFSTVEGTVSRRDILLGSWFIQEMCRNFSAYGRKEDVVSLFIRTTKCVSGNYYFTEDEITFKKQLPMLISTLSKKFYLNKNKDRHFLLHYTEKMQNIIALVNEIKQYVAPNTSPSSSRSYSRPTLSH
nr:unnamed protein product [Callosobruchus chinensis]